MIFRFFWLNLAYSCWNLNKLYAQIIFFLYTIPRTTKHYRYMIVKCKPVEAWLIKVGVNTLIIVSWVSLRRVTLPMVNSPKPQWPGLLTRFHRQVTFQFSVLWPQPGVCSPSGTTLLCGRSNKWHQQQTWIPKQSSDDSFLNNNNNINNNNNFLKISWHKHYCLDEKTHVYKNSTKYQQKCKSWQNKTQLDEEIKA